MSKRHLLKRHILIYALVLACGRFLVAAEPVPKLPVVPPEQAGLDGTRLARMDALIEQAIAAGDLPGCVVAIGHQGKIGWLKAYGHRLLEPEPVPMTTDTVFDLASLTKPIATATSVMLLIERGQVRLRDRVADHLPEFGTSGKESITIEQLLIHTSGLIPDNALRDYENGYEEAFKRIYELTPTATPGERFIYSDVNFLVLAELVRRVTGQRIDEFARENIFAPLGMNDTGYVPDESLAARAAPTERRGDRWMQGEVHDPRAYAIGGVAGHAGLFSTAEDLAVYAQMMLGRGEYAGRQILGAATVERMTRGDEVPRGIRGLGWDKRTGFSSNRGEFMSSAAFGHGGFTGTGIWIDPEHDLFVIFLSSRLYPDGKGQVNSLIGRIGTIAVAAIRHEAARRQSSLSQSLRPESANDAAAAAPKEVLTGLDVLRRENFALLEGKRVGLITNHTSVARDGTPILELLHAAPNVKLTALFSPEHGFEGKLDISKIGDATEETTGLTIHSLYGEVRKPTPEHLAGIDVLVFDIQDIGARFYTYISTMGLALESLHELKRDTGRSIPMIVLDRPNPVGGEAVEGPVLDPGLESFVGFHTIAVRHGMTVGELARMFVAEREWDVDLTVVSLEGWTRSQEFDETNLPWIDPSPNMRSMDAALLYPGIGLLETTNISVGRGTDTPFEVLGAPWINSLELARELNSARLPGVRFVPITFTPESSVHAQQQCGGVRIVITDRAMLAPLDIGWEVARQLRRLYSDEWKVERYARLLGDAAVLDAVRRAEPRDSIRAVYQDELEEFRARRARYLLYP